MSKSPQNWHTEKCVYFPGYEEHVLQNTHFGSGYQAFSKHLHLSLLNTQVGTCRIVATVHLASEKDKILFNKMQKYHLIEFIKQRRAKVSCGVLTEERRRSNPSIFAVEEQKGNSLKHSHRVC